jgi:hypothetical protein
MPEQKKEGYFRGRQGMLNFYKDKNKNEKR